MKKIILTPILILFLIAGYSNILKSQTFGETNEKSLVFYKHNNLPEYLEKEERLFSVRCVKKKKP